MYEFNEYARGGQIVEGEINAFEVNCSDLRFGDHTGYFKFGVKRLTRDKTSDQDMEVFDGFGGDLTLAGFTAPGKEDLYANVREYDFGPRMDYDALEAFFTENIAGFELSALSRMSTSPIMDSWTSSPAIRSLITSAFSSSG